MNPDQDDVVETSLDGLLQMDHFAQVFRFSNKFSITIDTFFLYIWFGI